MDNSFDILIELGIFTKEELEKKIKQLKKKIK
jgi:hypothetical protein